MTPDPYVVTSNEEWFTVRDGGRDLNDIVDRLQAGELEKAVLLRRSKMVAAVVPISRLEVREQPAGLREALERIVLRGNELHDASERWQDNYEVAVARAGWREALAASPEKGEQT
jgi:antitoxin (DNA-binding transcriptional repressor) of toxin-antitoxin stability system